jgi:hypothetical protein
MASSTALQEMWFNRTIRSAFRAGGVLISLRHGGPVELRLDIHDTMRLVWRRHGSSLEAHQLALVPTRAINGDQRNYAI